MMKVPTRLIWKTSTCLTLPSLARATWYAQAAATRPDRAPPAKRGPKTALSDEALVAAIRAVLAVSPFTGEGYRKVWAKLRAEGIRSGKSRVLRLMGAHGLLAPQRGGGLRAMRRQWTSAPTTSRAAPSRSAVR